MEDEGDKRSERVVSLIHMVVDKTFWSGGDILYSATCRYGKTCIYREDARQMENGRERGGKQS